MHLPGLQPLSPRGRRPGGMTLVEVLIASALFTSLAAMMAMGIKMGMDSQDFGNRVRKSQELCKDAARIVVGELRTAVPLPTVGSGLPPVPSGVLWPDAYGVEDGNERYPLRLLIRDDGAEIHRATNRLIFTRPRNAVQDANFDPLLQSNYLYVEYLVPDALPNRIYRRARPVGVGGAAGAGHRSLDGRWLVDQVFFTGTAGLLNPQEQDQLIALLPGAQDRFELHVSHPRYLNELTGQPGTEAGFGSSFSRVLYDVEVVATVRHRGSADHVSVQRMQGQARIQAGQ